MIYLKESFHTPGTYMIFDDDPKYHNVLVANRDEKGNITESRKHMGTYDGDSVTDDFYIGVLTMGAEPNVFISHQRNHRITIKHMEEIVGACHDLQDKL